MKLRPVFLKVMAIITVYVLGMATWVLLEQSRPAPVEAEPDRAPSFTLSPISLQVESATDAETVRLALWDYLFGETPIAPAVCGADECTVTMQQGFISHIRIRRPEQPNGALLLYQTGHWGEWVDDTQAITRYVEAGYTVAVFDMPLLGVNPPVWVEFPQMRRLQLTRHDQMQYLEVEGSPIRLFVEPVIATLNAIEGVYERIIMTGVSGGGWTTTLVAAMDTRIEVSIPVAGSLPLPIRFAREDAWGDWEQMEPTLYVIADYADLYVLGAQGRQQIQILNYHDPCCFSGDFRALYEPQVASAVAALDGRFEVWLDSVNREHRLSVEMQARLLEALTTPPD